VPAAVGVAAVTLAAIVARHAAGELSAQLALMQLLIESEDVRAVERVVADTPALAAMLEGNRGGCARICAMLKSGVDSPAPAASVEEGLAFAARLFDWSVQQSEEASVALYSLGNPALLAAATAEVVALLEAWHLLGPDRRVLQIGCGIGRIEQALASRVAEAHGIDVSARMIDAARRRCAGLPNVHLHHTDGRDLARFPAGSFDLVYAVDSFPYLVQAGSALVERHFADAARVLVPGGALAILGFSYRDDLSRDRADVRAAAGALSIERDGERPFTLWDAAAWLLRR
jgi:SAM-dependent methyltransferase